MIYGVKQKHLLYICDSDGITGLQIVLEGHNIGDYEHKIGLVLKTTKIHSLISLLKGGGF